MSKEIIRLSIRFRNKFWYISAPDLGLETSGKLFAEAVDRIYLLLEDKLGIRYPLYELVEKPTTQFRFHLADSEEE